MLVLLGLSHHIGFSSSVHLHAHFMILFFIAKQYSTVYACRVFVIHLSVEGRLGGIQCLAVGYPTVNMDPAVLSNKKSHTFMCRQYFAIVCDYVRGECILL